MGSTCSRNSDISPHQQQEEVPYDPQGFEKILLEALKEYFSNTKLVWRNKYEVCDICGTRRHPQYHIDSKDKFKDHCIFVFNNTSYPIIASCTFSPQIKQKLKSFDVSLSGSPTSGGVTFGATMEDRVLDAVTLEQMTIFPGSICVFQVGGRIQSFVSVEIVLPVDSNKKEKYVHLYTDKKMYYEQVLVINLPESVNRVCHQNILFILCFVSYFWIFFDILECIG